MSAGKRINAFKAHLSLKLIAVLMQDLYQLVYTSVHAGARLVVV
jgi:hypothetical protein